MKLPKLTWRQAAEPEEGKARPPAKPETSEERQDWRDERPAWWTLGLLLFMAALLVVFYGISVHAASFLLLELLIAIGAAVSGALLGFLFGLPRAGQLKDDTRTNAAVADSTSPAPTGRQYEPNTNLEQVSDWLTKILIGVGLVELQELTGALGRAGDLVTEAVGGPAGAGVVTQAVIVSFVIVGFLGSFLWTRVHYSRIQRRTDIALDDLQQLKRAVKEESSKNEEFRKATNEIARATLAPTVAQAAAPPPVPASLPTAQYESLTQNWPADVRTAFQALLDAPVDWGEDDVDNHFPGRSPQANGRVLEGEIVADLGREAGLVIRLIVRLVSGRPFSGKVVFLLHSSFRERFLVSQVRNDRAEATTYSEEWFTVGAILDDGQTVLTYDLRNLPNVPQWFKGES